MSTLTLLFLVAGAISYVSSTQAPVNLGSAENYVILAETGVTTTGTTAIVGDIAVSPAAATSMTGFSLILDASGTFSKSNIVTGKVYAADYASPTPAVLTIAIQDQVSAYNDAAGRTNPDYLNVGINGPSTLQPGLYKWTSAQTCAGGITLNGTSTSVFIFQVGGTLTFADTTQILLTGGVSPSNVFWQAAGAVTFNAGSQIQGIVLGKTAISFNSGAKLVKGRALAQTAVTMISNAISMP